MSNCPLVPIIMQRQRDIHRTDVYTHKKGKKKKYREKNRHTDDKYLRRLDAQINSEAALRG